MYGHSSERWHRHRGNGWIVPLVVIGLIILTNGWILFIPLMALAALAFFGFVLPKIAWHAQHSHHSRHMHHSRHDDWQHQDWSWMSEKRKRHFQEWGNHWNHMRDGEKPKRDSRDDIEYV